MYHLIVGAKTKWVAPIRFGRRYDVEIGIEFTTLATESTPPKGRSVNALLVAIETESHQMSSGCDWPEQLVEMSRDNEQRVIVATRIIDEEPIVTHAA